MASYKHMFGSQGFKNWISQKAKNDICDVATQKDKTDLLKQFLILGVDPNYGSIHRRPIITASQSGCHNNVQMLIDYGACIDSDLCSRKQKNCCPDDMGYTSLFYAVSSGSFDTVNVLLRAGANPNKICSPLNLTPLENAIRHQHEINTDLVIDLLLPKTKYRTELLYRSIKSSNWNLVTKICNAYGIDISKDQSLLRIASYNLTMTKRLLEIGLNPNAEGLFPLHVHAVSENHSEILSEYIKYGANVNAQDQNGMTPLMIAISRKITYAQHPMDAIGNVKGVEILLGAGAPALGASHGGANKNLKCNKGFTALDYANSILKGNFDYIETDRAPIYFTKKEKDDALESYKNIVDLLMKSKL